MSGRNYSHPDITDKQARALATNVSISTKQAIEISSFIRGKKTKTAKRYLQEIIDHKRALPMRRFNQEGAGHKKGKVGPGRYPEKAANAFHDLLKSVESNAKYKGLIIDNLFITHVCAHKGPQQPRYGRKRGVVAKRTHIEIVVEQKQQKPEASRQQKKPGQPQKATATQAKDQNLQKSQDKGKTLQPQDKEAIEKKQELKQEPKEDKEAKLEEKGTKAIKEPIGIKEAQQQSQSKPSQKGADASSTEEEHKDDKAPTKQQKTIEDKK